MIEQEQYHGYRHEYYTKSAFYELICDKCGKSGVSEGTFKECVEYVKKNNWKSTLWNHLCPKCNRSEYKNDNHLPPMSGTV